MLTADLLAELDGRLHDVGAPISRFWRPGLKDAQMDARTAEIGLSLPTEARIWWGWHDGIDVEAARSQASLGPSWDALSLEAAAQDAVAKRDMAARAAEGGLDPRDDWSDSWIALCGDVSYPRIACDCGLPLGTPSTIHYFDPEFNDYPRHPKAASIGELVHIWLEALADGTWHIDPRTGEFASLDPTELVKAKGRDIADLL
jgi:cell wall assembly regulator SMI1